MKIFTIGFTGKSAQQFFDAIDKAGIKKVVDIRLNNVSQLAAFAKRNDLKYFLKEICKVKYDHQLDLAPTKNILDEYKKNGGSWENYENEFKALMVKRQIQNKIKRETFADACLLCSEKEEHNCHRRLVAEYLKEHWGDIEIVHLS